MYLSFQMLYSYRMLLAYFSAYTEHWEGQMLRMEMLELLASCPELFHKI